MWVAVKAFKGIIGGKEKSFPAGVKISDADAKELNLAKKPDLAKTDKK